MHFFYEYRLSGFAINHTPHFLRSHSSAAGIFYVNTFPDLILARTTTRSTT